MQMTQRYGVRLGFVPLRGTAVWTSQDRNLSRRGRGLSPGFCIFVSVSAGDCYDPKGVPPKGLQDSAQGLTLRTEHPERRALKGRQGERPNKVEGWK
jgi:hypothetical protein